MNFPDAVKSAFKNWNNLSGRASRSEFWWVVLFWNVFNIGFNKLLSNNPSTEILLLTLPIKLIFNWFYTALQMVFLLCLFSLSVRRLHDSGQSARWHYGLWGLLIGLILWAGMDVPYLGIVLIGAVFCAGFFLFLMMLIPGSKRTNIYGPDPLKRDVSHELS